MLQASYFEYGQKEIGWLAARDPVLGKFLCKVGFIKREIFSDPFTGLVNAVIGQQLSARAFDAIWKRFFNFHDLADPYAISKTSLEQLRLCGLSRAKARCIKDVAGLFADGTFNADEMAAMGDEEVGKCLLKIRGIGPWTVEMFLIFTFQRKNIFSFGDFALKKGLCSLYGHKTISRKLFNEYYKIYSPYSTIASFYLWEAAKA